MPDTHPCSGTSSESVPLLMPAEASCPRWAALGKKELGAEPGGASWRRLRCRLVLLFWISWLCLLGGAIAIIILSPRPVTPALPWWKTTVLCHMDASLALHEGIQLANVNDLREHLPYLKSLGVGAVVLGGVLGTLSQLQLLVTEGQRAGVRVILDLCGVDLQDPGLPKLTNESEAHTWSQQALRLWLEVGVAGFSVCDTDVAYSQQTLMVWREMLQEYSQSNSDRIVVLKQVGGAREPLNSSLVDVVMRPLLPHMPLNVSVSEAIDGMQTHLQAWQDGWPSWPSWMEGGAVSERMQRLQTVLMMTVPGTPVLNYSNEIRQSETGCDGTDSSFIRSLTSTRSREEALLYGNMTVLRPTSSSCSLLAFLRSWSCMNILVLMNWADAEVCEPEPGWLRHLPDTGVFVGSTAPGRTGPVTLRTLTLQPQEAVIIRL